MKITSASHTCPTCENRFHNLDSKRKQPVMPFCSVACAAAWACAHVVEEFEMCRRCLRWNEKGTPCVCQKETGHEVGS